MKKVLIHNCILFPLFPRIKMGADNGKLLDNGHCCVREQKTMKSCREISKGPYMARQNSRVSFDEAQYLAPNNEHNLVGISDSSKATHPKKWTNAQMLELQMTVECVARDMRIKVPSVNEWQASSGLKLNKLNHVTIKPQAFAGFEEEFRK